MVAAIENSCSQSENFLGLLIDFDHFSLDAEKHSEAVVNKGVTKTLGCVVRASRLRERASFATCSTRKMRALSEWKHTPHRRGFDRGFASGSLRLLIFRKMILLSMILPCFLRMGN